jgi:hypothetical protein
LSAILGSLGDLGDDDSIQNLLEGMMGQLMGKDVLYEPLKELNDKFPSYLSSNADKLSPSELTRYRAQHTCASKIVAIFEDSKYKDDDPKIAADVVTLMTEVYSLCSPAMQAAKLTLLTHRCKSTVLPQRRLWVSYLLDSSRVPMVLRRCQRVV